MSPHSQSPRRKTLRPKRAHDIALKSEDGTPRDPVSILVDLGKRHVLFVATDGTPYAKVQRQSHVEVHAVDGRGFASILAADFHDVTGSGVKVAAIKDAVVTIAAITAKAETRLPVFCRVATSEGRLIIDRGDPRWSSFVATESSWDQQPGHSVNFRRSPHMLALPLPGKADLSALWRLVSVREEDRPLVLGWLVGALSGRGTYPILAITGEAGSGKSTASRMLKRLVDPSEPLLRPVPKDIDALRVAAISSHVLAFDNLSGLKPEMSDALCMVASGGALSARTKYTDAEETLIHFKRPVILNGIEGIMSRTDLSSRSIHLDLPACETRRTEHELEALFERHAGDILAALLDGVSRALKNQDQDFGELPRLADFAKWAAAAMPAFGYQPAEFLDAFRRNADQAMLDHVDDSAFAQAVIELVTMNQSWVGSGNALLEELRGVANSRFRGMRWPKSAKAAIGELRRYTASLRIAGISFEQRRNAGSRFIELTYCSSAS